MGSEMCIRDSFTSGYVETDLPEALRRVPVVGKPYAADALGSAFAAIG